MKKYFLITLSLFLTVTASAQNVGIGTNTPAAKLQINNTGVRPSLLLFDSTADTGYPSIYFKNAGSDDAWRIGGRIYSGNPSESYFDFLNTQMLGSFNLTLRGNGNIGINQPVPNYKLDIDGDMNITGPLRVNGNAGTGGQVLVSNGASAPAWQALSIPIGFSGLIIDTRNAPNVTDVPLTSYVESFDDGGDNFNASTGVFTAPSSGLYHFDIQITWAPAMVNKAAAIRMYINGSMCTICQVGQEIVGGRPYDATHFNSFNIKLTTGDAVRVSVYQASGGLELFGAGTAFSGYKVY